MIIIFPDTFDGTNTVQCESDLQMYKIINIVYRGVNISLFFTFIILSPDQRISSPMYLPTNVFPHHCISPPMYLTHTVLLTFSPRGRSGRCRGGCLRRNSGRCLLLLQKGHLLLVCWVMEGHSRMPLLPHLPLVEFCNRRDCYTYSVGGELTVVTLTVYVGRIALTVYVGRTVEVTCRWSVLLHLQCKWTLYIMRLSSRDFFFAENVRRERTSREQTTVLSCCSRYCAVPLRSLRAPISCNI